MTNLKIITAAAIAGLALAGCQSPRTSSAGATAPAAPTVAQPTVGVQPPANTAGLPRNDTTGANDAQNCNSAADAASRQHCLERGTAPTSPSERPVDGGS